MAEGDDVSEVSERTGSQGEEGATYSSLLRSSGIVRHVCEGVDVWF